jgi:DNA-binding winged helix-turn-helix (wHTH) protein
MDAAGRNLYKIEQVPVEESMPEPDQQLRYYLWMSVSTDPTITRCVDLTEDVTLLGRPEQEEPHYVDIQLARLDELLIISRKHARLERQKEGYQLTNVSQSRPIRIYEHRLGYHQACPFLLRPCDVFHIPDVEGAHVRIVLYEHRGTRVLPLEIEHQRQGIIVFGKPISFAGRKYKLLSYLHQYLGQVCFYHNIIEHLWPDERNSDELYKARRTDLERMLNEIRNKIRSESGGYTFLETSHAEGVRLII